MKTNPIERACEVVGSQAKLAEILCVHFSMISQWVHGHRQVPSERCPDIEKATKGAVTCEELRPDLLDQWSYLRGTKKRKAA
jgi:DNA-binding transcriptional regulator YdaS (Cro superfamily)